MKKAILAASAAAMIIASAMPASAGWLLGDGANAGKWWYSYSNGSYPKAQWAWIDGNNDGIMESYYFDGDGWLLTNTTTPDGYTVNDNGAWVVNGVVQTKAVSARVSYVGKKASVKAATDAAARNGSAALPAGSIKPVVGSSSTEDFDAFQNGTAATSTNSAAVSTTETVSTTTAAN